MKLTKSKLKQIIKEELLNEAIATVGYSKEMGAIYVKKKGQAGGKSLELYKKDIEEIIKMYKKHKKDMD
jgi:hypothetical protein